MCLGVYKINRKVKKHIILLLHRLYCNCVNKNRDANIYVISPKLMRGTERSTQQNIY